MFRFAVVLLLVSPSLGLNNVSADEPLRTVVSAATANVYSGPSEAYYATAELPQGTVVEVYRMTADGWCGVRPPNGSFSYVRADHVRVDGANPDRLTTLVDETKTRVGSLLSASYNVEYIALEKGERLKIVGEPVRLGSPPVQWHRISPPSGEFRWIRRDELAIGEKEDEMATKEPLAAAKIDADEDADETQVILTATSPDALSELANADSGVTTEKLNTRGSMSTIPIPIAAEEATVDHKAAEKPEAEQVVQQESAWKAVGSGTVDIMPVQASPVETVDRSNSNPPLITVLAELDVDLAQQVKNNVGDWQLDRLLTQANNLYGRAMDASTRQRINTIRDRILQFQDIQRRHLSLAPFNRQIADDQVALASAVVPAPRPPQREARPAVVTHSLQPDVVRVEGWLVPVQSSRRDIPRFALTDRNGEILYFVTPPRGLNLSRLQTAPVQVVGRRGPAGGDQLVAERVTPLGSNLR